jgi:phosphoglycolate phosphatase-like HAD superfamily hydrolase
MENLERERWSGRGERPIMLPSRALHGCVRFVSPLGVPARIHDPSIESRLVSLPESIQPLESGAPVRLAWLFDVDGTLLLTQGAAREAFADAVERVLGVRDDLRDIAFAGRTEPLILADILGKHRITWNRGQEDLFWNEVFANMRERLAPGRGGLLPGVPELLRAIEDEPTWVKGLLTGNMTAMAAIKLTHYGISGRFAFGAYGQEASDRNQLARLAVGRVRNLYGVPPQRCIVIGDTEHDIACARAAGTRVVAVATGSRRLAELVALEPDLVLEDLTEVRDLLDWAREIAAEE